MGCSLQNREKFSHGTTARAKYHILVCTSPGTYRYIPFYDPEVCTGYILLTPSMYWKTYIYHQVCTSTSGTFGHVISQFWLWYHSLDCDITCDITSVISQLWYSPLYHVISGYGRLWSNSFVYDIIVFYMISSSMAWYHTSTRISYDVWNHSIYHEITL
jgi:hypothetical protein